MKHIKLFNESFQDKENPGYWEKIDHSTYFDILTDLNTTTEIKISDRNKNLIHDIVSKKKFIKDKERFERAKIRNNITNRLFYTSRSKNPSQMLIVAIEDEYFIVRFVQWEFEEFDYVNYYKCDQIEGLVDLLEQLPDAK